MRPKPTRDGVAGGPPNASSPGAALKLVHDAFRRELSIIRREFAESGPRLGAQLRVNCLTMCQGLRFHHTSEDSAMLPALAERHPELAPTIDRLHAEHDKIAELLEELQATVAAEDSDPRQAQADVERLTGELERHLDYEEQQLIPVLDTF